MRLVWVLLFAFAGAVHAQPGGSTAEVLVEAVPASVRAGTRLAGGERYDPTRLTAAHRTLPFGTLLRVTNPRLGVTVTVRINDRTVLDRQAVLALSAEAAKQAGLVGGSRRLTVTLPPEERAALRPDDLRYLFDPNVPRPDPPAPDSAATAERPVPPSAPPPPPPLRYTVQVGVFSDLARAQAMAAPITGAWVYTDATAAPMVYRVYVGLYATLDLAAAARTRLRAEGRQGFVRTVTGEARPPAAAQIRW